MTVYKVIYYVKDKEKIKDTFIPNVILANNFASAVEIAKRSENDNLTLYALDHLIDGNVVIQDPKEFEEPAPVSELPKKRKK